MDNRIIVPRIDVSGDVVPPKDDSSFGLVGWMWVALIAAMGVGFSHLYSKRDNPGFT